MTLILELWNEAADPPHWTGASARWNGDLVTYTGVGLQGTISRRLNLDQRTERVFNDLDGKVIGTTGPSYHLVLRLRKE